MVTVTEQICSRLTSPYDDGQNSNNRRLIKPIGDECDEFYIHILNVKKAHFIDEATGASLDRFGEFLQTFRTTSETDQHYRARLKTMFARFSSSGTIQHLKDIISTILSVPTTRVEISEDFTGEISAQFAVRLWLPDVTAAGLTEAELLALINNVKGAGIFVITYKRGTFEYGSIAAHSDSTRGYTDLINSNPSGGTYAGIL